jgi:hypothetical protein
MASSEPVVTALRDARAALDGARASEAAAREALRALKARSVASSRSTDRDNPDKGAPLEPDVARAQAVLADATSRVKAAQSALAKSLAAAAPQLNPVSAVGGLSSATAITLLPVRVETRFGVAQTGKPQLWVRIYPDDCWIDSFETQLTMAELQNAKTYWTGFWRAGGVEADQRAAWRSLAAAHGSGRANYILDSFAPLNAPPTPKVKQTDVFLVIPTGAAPPPADQNALCTYWSAIWLADDDQTQIDIADAAFRTAVGSDADALLSAYIPENLADEPTAPLRRDDVTVKIVFVVFPPDPAVQQDSWSSAPRVSLFPDCFAVVAYNGGREVLTEVTQPVSYPLFVGVDPGDTADPLHVDPATGDLVVPSQLQWMVDFPTAVAAGLGIAIDLSEDQAREGFDRLLVIGLRLSADDGDGQQSLEELLTHHAQSGSGLEILAQGTPTHNTTGMGSGYSRRDDPDQSFDDRLHSPLFTETSDDLQKRDGQILAEALGVSPATFYRVHGADGEDQRQGRAVQSLLWPATLGYWMDKLMTPVFSDETVENARWYFETFVRGRGVVPPIRIGKQAYGILPTTAFSRMEGFTRTSTKNSPYSPSQWSFLAALYGFLRRVDPDWTHLAASASFVGKQGDPHQILLDILGLHPDSAEFRSRTAESAQTLWNILNLGGQGTVFWPILQNLLQQGLQRLRELGYEGDAPDLLQLLFVGESSLIATLVDDRPSSESAPVRPYTTDGRNYLRWLSDAARSSLDALQQEQGFAGNQTPQALLYLLARHALMLGYYDTTYRLYATAQVLPATELAAMKPEPLFVHVDANATASESRFAKLYSPDSRITGNTTLLVSDYITRQFASLPQAAQFSAQLAALDVLQQAPTAALERLLAEHIDTCSYRIDSWLLGLASLRLNSLRKNPGTCLGAYAWLEEVRPAATPLEPVELPAAIAEQFPGDAPLEMDPANGGYILAPSIPQSKTAAVLRSGYVANATAENPQTLSVNLTSDRVRLALSLLEGIRNGQSLGALLGYRFERGLHDDHNLAEVDKFIYPLRKAFPLVADSLTATKTGPGVPIEAIEASNVLDGRKLIAQIQSSGQSQYPFGLTSLPGASTAESGAINLEVAQLLDANDAVADLALAEGVHQAVQGNFDRLAGTLNTYSTGNSPPEPEVIQTPISGVSINHRVAVHFSAGVAPPANATPRAAAEPALNDWLGQVLPDPADIRCTVRWNNPVTAAPGSSVVSLDDLGLLPIDVVALVRPDDGQAMTELDDRVVTNVLGAEGLRPDVQMNISYRDAPAGKISVFAASGLIRAVRTVLTRSRPLRATDSILQSDVQGDPNAATDLDRSRLADRIAELTKLRTANVDSFTTFLSDPLIVDPAGSRAQVLQGIDDLLGAAAALLERAARFALPQSGWGFIADWKRKAFSDLIAAVAALVTRWDAKLTNYNTKHAAYLALPAGTDDETRFRALRAMELVVSTVTAPLPATPAALQTVVEQKAQDFQDRRDEFDAVTQTADASFAHLLSSVEGLLPVLLFDTKAFDVTEFEDRAITVARDLGRMMASHKAKLDERQAAAQAALSAADAAADTGVKTTSLQQAAKAIFGDDFVLYPRFSLPQAQRPEWSNAYGYSSGGSLLKYLTQTMKFDFPVMEWLGGAARVRPALRAWETVCNLAAAFDRTIDLSFTPIQFPYDNTASWAAMQIDPAYTVSSEHLLYTARFSPSNFKLDGSFDPQAPQCGFLLDEWPEVIPSADRTAGLTFNYTRPNAEAPQAILIVTPATSGEHWQWEDLVGALNETLDLAKKRAFEPVHMSAQTDARFLPATVTASTTYAITIATALTAANGVFERIQRPG